MSLDSSNNFRDCTNLGKWKRCRILPEVGSTHSPDMDLFGGKKSHTKYQISSACFRPDAELWRAEVSKRGSWPVASPGKQLNAQASHSSQPGQLTGSWSSCMRAPHPLCPPYSWATPCIHGFVCTYYMYLDHSISGLYVHCWRELV